MSQCLTQKEPVRYTNKLIKKTTDTKLQRILAVNKKITAPPMPLYLFCLVYCFQVGLLYNRWNWAILDLHATYLHLKITMWLLLFLMCLPQCAVVGCCSLLGIHSPISSHLVLLATSGCGHCCIRLRQLNAICPSASIEETCDVDGVQSSVKA